MDIEKTLDFVLETQATHATGIAKHDEAIARLEANLDKLVTIVEHIVQGQDRLTGKVDTMVDALAEAVARAQSMAEDLSTQRPVPDEQDSSY